MVAYELLFRDALHARAASRRSAEATSRVIVAAFTDFGLDQLVGSRACFINVTREFLVGELPVPFAPDQAVLEIVQDVEVDDAVVEGVNELTRRGFTVALGDFVVGAHERLLELATYVKIDLLNAEPAVVARAVHRCRQHPHVRLIAERLETETDLRRAFTFGFDLFQGHVLGRPHVVSTAGLSQSRTSRLLLLSTLSATEIDFDEAVALITRDPALSYRLLQATNSAATGLAVGVASVREAAVLLGLDRVRHWVTLMLLSDLAEADEDRLSVVLTRARVCQTAADRVKLSGEAAFTMGLLSGIADLVGQAPADLADSLPLSGEVALALAAGEGRLGALLAVVREYERGHPAGLAGLIDPDDAVRVYLDAVRWSTRLMATVHPTGPPPVVLSTA